MQRWETTRLSTGFWIRTTRMTSFIPCVRGTPTVWREQTNGVWGCCTSWSCDPDDSRYSAPSQQSVHTHTQRWCLSCLKGWLRCTSFLNMTFLTYYGYRFGLILLLLFSSHLRIVSKEPVLVTTLHSQQHILMLLFQLDDLLLQGSVRDLWVSGGGARLRRRSLLCTPSSSSSSWLGKLREAEPLQ